MPAAPLPPQLGLHFAKPAKTGGDTLDRIIKTAKGTSPRACANLSTMATHKAYGSEWLKNKQHVLALVLRDPCERLESAFDYGRKYLTNSSRFSPLFAVGSPREFALELLRSRELRVVWMAAPDFHGAARFVEEHGPNATLREVRTHTRHVRCSRSLGELCGFVPQAAYGVDYDSPRMRFACLPSLGADVQRLSDEVIGPGCPLEQALEATADKVASCKRNCGQFRNVRADGNRSHAATQKEAGLCEAAAALYPRDTRLWMRHCVAARVAAGTALNFSAQSIQRGRL